MAARYPTWINSVNYDPFSLTRTQAYHLLRDAKTGDKMNWWALRVVGVLDVAGEMGLDEPHMSIETLNEILDHIVGPEPEVTLAVWALEDVNG